MHPKAGRSRLPHGTEKNVTANKREGILKAKHDVSRRDGNSLESVKSVVRGKRV